MGFQSERDLKLDSTFYDLINMEDVAISNHLQEDSDNFIVIDEKIEGNKVKGENYRNLAEDLGKRRGTTVVYECGNTNTDSVDMRTPYYVYQNNTGGTCAIPLIEIEGVLRDRRRRVWHLIGDSDKPVLQNTISYWNAHFKGRILPGDHRNCENTTSMIVGHLIYCKGDDCDLTKQVRKITGTSSLLQESRVIGTDPHAVIVDYIFKDLEHNNPALYRKVLELRSLQWERDNLATTQGEKDHYDNQINRMEFDEMDVGYIEKFYEDEEREMNRPRISLVEENITQILQNVEKIVELLGPYINVRKEIHCLERYVRLLHGLGIKSTRKRSREPQWVREFEKIDLKNRQVGLREKVELVNSLPESAENSRILAELNNEIVDLERNYVFLNNNREINILMRGVMTLIDELDSNSIALLDIEILSIIHGLKRCINKYF
jgi:hypothetical protein